MTKCYRAHLARIDGQPIDTATGTLTFSHSYRNSKGQIYSPETVARAFKCQERRGFVVVRVEVFSFDPEA